MQLPHITFTQLSKHLQIFTSTSTTETSLMLPIYAVRLRGTPPVAIAPVGRLPCQSGGQVLLPPLCPPVPRLVLCGQKSQRVSYNRYRNVHLH